MESRQEARAVSSSLPRTVTGRLKSPFSITCTSWLSRQMYCTIRRHPSRNTARNRPTQRTISPAVPQRTQASTGS